MSVNKILYALLAIVVLGLLSASMLFERIEPGEIGVRQSLWGSGGLMKQDFTAGYHLGITGVHKWHVLDRRTHFLNFADESSQIETSRQHQNSQQMPALKIRTADNNVVTLDVTVDDVSAVELIGGGGSNMVPAFDRLFVSTSAGEVVAFG